MTGYHETNFSMAYSSHISWHSADSPVPQRSLSVASLRQPVRESRQPAESEHSGSGEGSRRSAHHQSQLDRQEQARRIPHQRSGSGAPRSGACARIRTKAEERAEKVGRPAITMERPPERPARRSPRAHQADDRYHRAGVPDGQDADCVAASGPRPVWDVLSVPAGPRRSSRSFARRSLGPTAYERITPVPSDPDGRPSPRSSTRCRKAKARCSTTR